MPVFSWKMMGIGAAPDEGNGYNARRLTTGKE